MRRFDGKLVVITGAAGGLGVTLARHFAAEGAELILTDVEERALELAGATLRAEGARCTIHCTDLAEESQIHELAVAILGQSEHVAVLINNAGLAYGEVAFGFAGLGQAKWLRVLSVNSVAPLLLAEALRPALARAKGVVLNVSSMASALPGTAYGVSKATLNAMTYGMASALGADGIRVNAIAPGIVDTSASKTQLPAGTYERIQAQQLLALHGVADDVAALALFLASDAARFITAEIMHCDAGNRLRGWRG
jgi:NAD(P)-dependent dehydrogenase (short-subunit alcohol dehydrogenase family)